MENLIALLIITDLLIVIDYIITYYKLNRKNKENNLRKASSTYQKKINKIDLKITKEYNEKIALKFENKQLHLLIDKMLDDGRLHMDELRTNVNSRKEIRKILSK